MEIECCDVCKTIKKKMVLKNVTLRLESGTIVGFVGRNGAGKTMLFRALAGLLPIDSGEIRVNDRVLYKDCELPCRVGIVLEHAGLYPELTGMDNLRLLGKQNKALGKEDRERAMLRVGLDPGDRRKYRQYSIGMKQRLLIAQAVMERPEFLLLDEPTNGLDEQGVELIRTLIREEKERGALVLLSSHMAEDIALLADTVYQVEAGVVTKKEAIA